MTNRNREVGHNQRNKLAQHLFRTTHHLLLQNTHPKPSPSYRPLSRPNQASIIMADLSQQQHDLNDPNNQLGYGDDAANDNESAGRPNKKRNIQDAGDDDDDDEKGGRERRKIDIKFIQDKSRRHITFSKRKAGIMKKVSLSLRVVVVVVVLHCDFHLCLLLMHCLFGNYHD
jgi:hypothetical protein